MDTKTILKYGEHCKEIITAIRNFKTKHKIKDKIEVIVETQDLEFWKHCIYLVEKSTNTTIKFVK